MKLAPREVASFVAAPRKAAGVLLYGPDTGLVAQRAQQIAKAAVNDTQDPFLVRELSEEQILADPPLLHDELSAMSLTGDKRLVLVRHASDKIADLAEEACATPGSDTFLLVTAGELPPRSALRLLFEHTPHLAALACYHDEGRGLEEIISATLARQKVRADRDALLWLSHHMGNDRQVTVSELEKLVIYAGEGGTLSLEDVLLLAGDNQESNFDDVCNAVAEGNFEGLETHLARLAREGTPAVVLLRALLRYFQRLYAITARMEAGESMEAVIASQRPPVFFRQKPRLVRQLSLWTKPRLASALNLLLQTEREAKSSGFPSDVLTAHICARLARGARHSRQAA